MGERGKGEIGDGREKERERPIDRRISLHTSLLLPLLSHRYSSSSLVSLSSYLRFLFYSSSLSSSLTYFSLFIFLPVLNLFLLLLPSIIALPLSSSFNLFVLSFRLLHILFFYVLSLSSRLSFLNFTPGSSYSFFWFLFTSPSVFLDFVFPPSLYILSLYLSSFFPSTTFFNIYIPFLFTICVMSIKLNYHYLPPLLEHHQ